jgi:hypothetical protein
VGAIWARPVVGERGDGTGRGCRGRGVLLISRSADRRLRGGADGRRSRRILYRPSGVSPPCPRYSGRVQIWRPRSRCSSSREWL